MEEPLSNNFEIPPNVVIDNLRNEIARLNDEKTMLAIKLQFQSDIISAYQHQLQQVEHPETPEEETQTDLK